MNGGTLSDTDYPFERSVLLTQGDSVHPELIDWLWPGWIASGKLHLVGGAPGTGKTTIAMSLAAKISNRPRLEGVALACPAKRGEPRKESSVGAVVGYSNNSPC